MSSDSFRQTLFNTILWIAIVPVVTVIFGLAIAVLADRLKPKSENLVKTIIFLPMAISMIGAATVWDFIFVVRPEGPPDRPPERDHRPSASTPSPGSR